MAIETRRQGRLSKSYHLGMNTIDTALNTTNELLDTINTGAKAVSTIAEVGYIGIKESLVESHMDLDETTAEYVKALKANGKSDTEIHDKLVQLRLV